MQGASAETPIQEKYDILCVFLLINMQQDFLNELDSLSDEAITVLSLEVEKILTFQAASRDALPRHPISIDI